MLETRLSARVEVALPVADVSAFLADPYNAPKWDRSVAKVVVTADGPPRPGYTFDTVGPWTPGRDGKITSYRVLQLDPQESALELVGSRVFRRCVWSIRLAPTATGTSVECDVALAVRPRYFFVAWLMRFLGGAVAEDLLFLRRTLEHGEVAKR